MLPLSYSSIFAFSSTVSAAPNTAVALSCKRDQQSRVMPWGERYSERSAELLAKRDLPLVDDALVTALSPSSETILRTRLKLNLMLKLNQSFEVSCRLRKLVHKDSHMICVVCAGFNHYLLFGTVHEE